jgi:uncharacterized protein involved in type VI secretion and phage assembly
MNPYELTIDGFSPDLLRVRSLVGTESMSHTYSFMIDAVAEGTSDELERLVLGQKAALMWQLDGPKRAFYGVIDAVDLLASIADQKADQKVGYRLRFVPRMSLLKHKRRTRIFQGMAVPDVVTKVLLEAGIAARWQLTRPYPVREYCTQYEETDYQFVTRLLAEAGIYFSFAQGGPVDDAFQVLAAVAGGVGSIGASIARDVAGAAVGSMISSGASAMSPVIPGDTIIGGDDAVFYAPIGADDVARLAATTAATLLPEAAGSIAAGVGGMPPAGEAALGQVSAGAGTIIGAIAAEAATPLRYLPVVGEATPLHPDQVSAFTWRTGVAPTGAVFRDYDPERPLTRLESFGLSVAPFPASGLEAFAESLMTAGSIAGSVAPGVAGEIGATVGAQAGQVALGLEGVLGEHAPPYLEIYDHHSPYLFPKWSLPNDEAPRMLRQARRRVAVGLGTSGCHALGSGHKFALVGHDVGRLDQAYVVTKIEHRGHADFQHSDDAAAGATPLSQRLHQRLYQNRFECVKATIAYVPAKPPRRSVQVVLTAVVVGPAGEEIHVDPMGQIRVQFHWDREGKNDDTSSCWIRTMQPWGGAGWGVQFIPRIGMEVVVTFEGGDPDKPLVLGSVYNATHPSPFHLPALKTRSGWRTQSSPGGGGFNELSFDDAAGAEQIFLHAQRNLEEVVLHNHALRVENDELIRILGSRLDAIEKNLEERVHGDHSSHVDGNRVAVVRGNADHRVGGMLATRVEGREQRDVEGPSDAIHSGDVSVRILGCATTIVGKNDKKRSWTTHAEGTATLSGLDRLELRSDGEIVLAVGDSAIRLTQDGIELSSPNIASRGKGGSLSVGKDGLAMKANGTKIVMDEMVIVTSVSASMSLGKQARLDGGMVLLNSPDMATDEPPKPPEPPTKIEVVDQDGAPVAFQRFVAKLDDGAEVSGKTDEDGKAELDLQSSGKIVFAELAMSNEPAQGDMQPYVVRQGDFLTRLAFAHGFDADKVWNDGKNAELKDKRKNHNILYPGDVIYLPRAEREGAPLSKGTTNKYDVNVPKTTVSVVFVEGDKAVANEPYVIDGLGKRVEGSSDGAGTVTFEAPVHVREVVVTFPKRAVAYPIRIGHMDPIDEPAGIRKRLQQLGYYDDFDGEAGSAEEEDERLSQAISAYQLAKNLEVTGTINQALKDALLRDHKS